MENPKLEEIEKQVGIVKKRAFEYWEWYNKGRIDNLKLKYKGRTLNKEEIEQLKEKAKEGFDSLKLIQEWIREEFNKELSIKTINPWCKKLGIKKRADLLIKLLKFYFLTQKNKSNLLFLILIYKKLLHELIILELVLYSI